MDAERDVEVGCGGSSRALEGRLSDERFLVWLDMIRAQARVTEDLECRLEEEAGIPLAFSEVLVQLEKTPEKRMRMQELGRSIFLSKSGVSRLVSRMECEGLVERQGDPENLRATYAAITDKGREVFQKAAPVSLREVEERFSRYLDKDEAEIMRRVLGRVIRACGDEPSVPRQHPPDPS